VRASALVVGERIASQDALGSLKPPGILGVVMKDTDTPAHAPRGTWREPE